MKKTTTLLLIFLGLHVYGQDPVFSQYMFNGMLINPAIAGSKSAISTALFYKRQWMALTEGPNIYSFNIHSPIYHQKIGIGFQTFSEKYNIQNRVNVTGTLCYRINLAKGVLSFGVSTGFIQNSLQYSSLKVLEEEQQYLKPDVNIMYPDIGSGLYFQHNTFYFGISGLHLISNSLSSANSNIKRQFNFMAGKKIILTERWEILPSCLVKFISGSVYQGDLTTHVKYNDLLWAGVSYRTQNYMSLQFGLKLSDLISLARQSIKIGYAYDWNSSSTKNYLGATHELMLVCDFNVYPKVSTINKKKINISPILF